MGSLDVNSHANATQGGRFTAGDFYREAQERLGLRLLAGENALDDEVEEPIIYRPGLALTGFWTSFAAGRVQMLGNAEAAYLNSFDEAERRARLIALIDHGARFFIFTDSHEPTASEIAVAKRKGAVFFVTKLPTRVVAREATYVLEKLAAPRTSLYGTMVEVFGMGVLLEGEPGLGKSETALGLLKHGSALIADDLTCIRKDVATNYLFGSAGESTSKFMEIRGIGIIHVPSVFGINAVRGEKRLQLVITLRHISDLGEKVDRIGNRCDTRRVLDVDIPNIILPVSEGRDLVNLVETAVQQQKLVNEGYDPVASLSQRLHERALANEPKREQKRRRHG